MLSTEKSISMLEMLFCLLVICGMLLIGLNHSSELKLDHYYFLNDYHLIQSEAILSRQNRNYEHGVNFNSMGHVYQGATIPFSRHAVIIHLGNGYATLR